MPLKLGIILRVALLLWGTLAHADTTASGAGALRIVIEPAIPHLYHCISHAAAWT